MASAAPTVTIDHVTKTFRAADRVGGGNANAFVVQGNLLREMVGGKRSSFTLSDLSLTFPAGQTTVILGPSGCGKSSLLRLLAGFETPDSGRILFGDHDMTASRSSERGLGMVFQDYALYPNLKAETNILSWFAFRKKNAELDALAQAKLARTAQLLGVSLTSLLGRMPRGLSGGERQRVALGRCLTRDPQLFLMDEPFSNLDAPLRERYRVELRRLLTEFKITTVFVTHDQAEASILGDQIAILNEGRVVQVGTSRDLSDAPVNRFVAEFWNPDSLLPAVVWLRVDGERLGFRPHHLRIEAPGPVGLPGTLLGQMDLPYGGRRVHRLEVQGQLVLVPALSGADPAPGPVTLAWSHALRVPDANLPA